MVKFFTASLAYYGAQIITRMEDVLMGFGSVSCALFVDVGL